VIRRYTIGAEVPLTTLADLQDVVRRFCQARDWDQFHTPKEIAIGVVTEGAELLDLFRFLDTDQQIEVLNETEKRERVENELADVLFFILRFAQRFEVDLAKALDRKITINDEKYPVGLSKGRNLKARDL
jgi:NTP pyrophosphatase (non-canonical NTP hydrolase)